MCSEWRGWIKIEEAEILEAARQIVEQGLEEGVIGPPGPPGPPGEPGEPGQPGQDGYTPIKGIDYFDGQAGEQGIPGEAGPTGLSGYTPVKNVDYFDGDPGLAGAKGDTGNTGADGYTPIKNVDYFDGVQGVQGVPGEAGYAPIKGVDYFDGLPGSPGEPGAAGYTPVKGIDYFDGEDGAQGIQGIQGETGQQGIQGPAGPSNYSLNVMAASLGTITDAATYYFGSLAALAPSTTAALARLYVPKAGVIKAVYVQTRAATAGTAENISVYVRLNNTADTLVQTVGLAAAVRLFSNTTLNIAVAQGDYIEIKMVCPTWATNPATMAIGGVIYIEPS
jgi:hypothetical protein